MLRMIVELIYRTVCLQSSEFDNTPGVQADKHQLHGETNQANCQYFDYNHGDRWALLACYPLTVSKPEIVKHHEEYEQAD